jgi:alanyl-tRNA synthetase
MIISDGGRPSNVDRGYVLRRLLRRMTRHMNKIGIDLSKVPEIIDLSINAIKELYPELVANHDTITRVIVDEINKFMRTLQNGEKEFEKVVSKVKSKGETKIDTEDVFNLFETYGFPPEMTVELANEQNITVDMEDFNRLFKEHQEKSRQGAEQKFKGGLAGNSEMEIKYHTATHLLNSALKTVLGEDSHQRGSNITPERLRFDFSHNGKLTDEEKQAVEDLVNKYIEQDIPVEHLEMNKEEALKMGAEAMFLDKYGDIVSVYKIGDISIELCGGPHVEHTGVLGHFKIKKEEASSAGVRRIKAILE